MKNPVKLQEFLEFLNSQSAEGFKGDGVTNFLTQRPFEPTAFSPFTFFRNDTYGRNLVSKNENYELIVITWLPRHRTPIHDHASSRCWMWMMRGTLTFRNYEFPRTDGAKGLSCLGPVETHSVGDVEYIDDNMAIHSISNASSEPAVSVHLYAAPIPRCRIYNETAKKLDWVDLCYFTEQGRNRIPESELPRA